MLCSRSHLNLYCTLERRSVLVVAGEPQIIIIITLYIVSSKTGFQRKFQIQKLQFHQMFKVHLFV